MEGRRAYQWSKYDAIAAVVAALMVRIKDDDKLRRFYDHRGAPTGSRASNNYWSISVRVVGWAGGLRVP